MPPGLPPSHQMAIESAKKNAAATAGASRNPFGFLSTMDLVSYGALVGLHFLNKAIVGRDPVVYDQRRTNLQINPQWPSRRLFGRVEVSGNLLWAGRRLYPWSGERSNTNPVWSPIEELQSKIPSFFNQRIVLLDRAIWLCEGTAEQIDYVRINGELVKLERVVLNGVPYYTPVRERFRYHSSVSSTIISPYYRKFYIREHFGVDRTDAELLARYSKQPDLDPDADLAPVEFDASGNQKVGYWHEEKKDEDQSWVAMTLIDDDSEFWEGRNLSEMSFIMRGQRVTDMRNPSGGLVWTDNAASVQYWIETNLVAGQDASSVSLRHFQDAYNWCAIQKHNDFEKYFELPDGSRREASQGEQAAFYRDMPAYSKNGTFNGIIEEGDDVDEIRNAFDEIRQGFRFPYAGRLCITVGKNLNFEHATVIDNADIVSIRPAPQPRQSESPNTLQARMASSQAHGYGPVELEISDEHAVARDGRPIVRSMGTLYGQTDYMEVARRMTSMVYRQRFNQRFRVTLLPQEKYFFLRPDAPVYLNSRMARKENYRCRVMAIEIAENGQITLMLRYAPPNEYLDQPVLPPIEQISEGLPVPLAVTDVTVHGSPGTKSRSAKVELEWPSPEYYRNTIIRWREQNGSWTSGVVFANTRGATQRQAIDYNFKVGTTYEFELVNQNRNGDLSLPYLEAWIARSDTEAPPALSGVKGYPAFRSFGYAFDEVDVAAVPDWADAVFTVTWNERDEPLVAQGTVSNYRVLPSSATVTLDMSPYFDRTEDVTFSAVSSNTHVVTVAVAGSVVTLTIGSTVGTSTVTVTGRDAEGSEATQTFTVSVVRPTAIAGGAAVRLLDLPSYVGGLALDADNDRLLVLYNIGANSLLGAYDPVTNTMVDIASGVTTRSFNFDSGAGIGGMAFLDETLYGVTYNRRLIEFNSGLTSYTDRGSILPGGTTQSIALTALNDTMYMVMANQLYTLNVTTKAWVAIGTAWPPNYFGLCHHGEKMYTIRWEPSGNAYLYEVTPSTGALTRVGTQTYAISRVADKGPSAMVGFPSLNATLNGLYVCNLEAAPTHFWRIP